MNNSKHQINQRDYESLLEKRDSLRKRQDEVGRDAGEAAGANSDWHDNPAYDYAVEEIRKLGFLIAQIDTVLNNSEIIEDKTGEDGTIVNGSRIVVEMFGDTEEYRIVGFNAGVPSDGTISSNSPLGKAVLGGTKGQVVYMETPNGYTSVKIIEVYPPNHGSKST